MRMIGWLVLCIAVATAPVYAQDEAGAHVVCGKTYDAGHPWSWESIEKKFGPLLEKRGYPRVFDGLVQEFGRSQIQTDAAIRNRFLASIEDVESGRKKCCADFQLLKDFDFDAGGDMLSVFKAADRRIDLADCGPNNKNAEQLDEVRYFAHAFENLGNLMLSAPRKATAERIKRIEAEFDQMLFHGFPMFPWETLANSLLLTDRKIANGPPNNQLILFHLGTGVETHVASFSQARLGAVLSVEPLGWIYYPKGKEHRTWWGAALLTTFRGDAGMGAGAALHYQNFSLGLTWHDTDGDNRLFDTQPFVFLGVDLYQFVGKKIRTYDEYRNRVQRALEEHEPETQ